MKGLLSFVFGKHYYIAVTHILGRCCCDSQVSLPISCPCRSWVGVNMMSPWCCRFFWGLRPHHVIYEAKALKCFIFIGHSFFSGFSLLFLAIYLLSLPTCPHFVENISLFNPRANCNCCCWVLVAGCRCRCVVAGCRGALPHIINLQTLSHPFRPGCPCPAH